MFIANMLVFNLGLDYWLVLSKSFKREAYKIGKFLGNRAVIYKALYLTYLIGNVESQSANIFNNNVV